MSTLTITKNWSANTTLTKAQLDEFETDLETFLNTTKLAYENLDIDSIIAALSDSQTQEILNQRGIGDSLSDTKDADNAISTSWTSIGLELAIPSAGDYLITGTATVNQIQAGNNSLHTNEFSFRIQDATNTATILPAQDCGITADIPAATASFDSSELQVPISWACIYTATGAATIRLELQEATITPTSKYVANSGTINSLKLDS